MSGLGDQPGNTHIKGDIVLQEFKDFINKGGVFEGNQSGGGGG